MNRTLIGIILVGTLLNVTSCGGGSMTKSFLREEVSLGHIQTVAVLPFEGDRNAPRIREFAMTQMLTSGLFDVADKGRVDFILDQEAIIRAGTPLDIATIRRLGQLLNVQAILFGSVTQETESRGNAVYPEITMTLRLIDCETGTLLWQASGRGSGYAVSDRLFGFAAKDAFQVTMDLLNNLFATIR